MLFSKINKNSQVNEMENTTFLPRPQDTNDSIDSDTSIRESHQDGVRLIPNVAVEVDVMGEKKRSNDVTGKKKKHARDPTPIKDTLTNVAHCCVVIFFLLIWYLCFTHPFEFFTWHPLLLSLGWMLLMTEAILAISKENVIIRTLKLSHTLRIRFHWVPLTIAAVVIAIGFTIVTISKNSLNKNHYTSWHGLLGLIGLIFYIPPCLNGIVLLYNKELKDYANPKIVKFVHVLTGTISITFGGMSLILSVYTKWFARNTNHNVYLFLFALIIATFPIIWTVQRPLIKLIKNFPKLRQAD